MGWGHDYGLYGLRIDLFLLRVLSYFFCIPGSLLYRTDCRDTLTTLCLLLAEFSAIGSVDRCSSVGHDRPYIHSYPSF